MEYRVTVDTVDAKGFQRTHTFVRDRSKSYGSDPFEEALVMLERNTREYEDVPALFRDTPHTLVSHRWVP